MPPTRTPRATPSPRPWACTTSAPAPTAGWRGTTGRASTSASATTSDPFRIDPAKRALRCPFRVSGGGGCARRERVSCAHFEDVRVGMQLDDNARFERAKGLFMAGLERAAREEWPGAEVLFREA